MSERTRGHDLAPRCMFALIVSNCERSDKIHESMENTLTRDTRKNAHTHISFFIYLSSRSDKISQSMTHKHPVAPKRSGNGHLQRRKAGSRTCDRSKIHNPMPNRATSTHTVSQMENCESFLEWQNFEGILFCFDRQTLGQPGPNGRTPRSTSATLR